jgi:hypothetical protein
MNSIYSEQNLLLKRFEFEFQNIKIKNLNFWERNKTKIIHCKNVHKFYIFCLLPIFTLTFCNEPRIM